MKTPLETIDAVGRLQSLAERITDALTIYHNLQVEHWNDELEDFEPELNARTLVSGLKALLDDPTITRETLSEIIEVYMLSDNLQCPAVNH